MKKFLTLLTAALLVLTLTACDPTGLLEELLSETPTVDTVLESEASQRQEQLDGYGYRALRTDEERRIYAILDARLPKGAAPEFTINSDDVLDNMGHIIEMYKNDHPEVFWIDDSHGYEYTKYPTYTQIHILTTLADEPLLQARRTFDAAADAFFEQMPDGLSDYEKELYINDALVTLCTYDTEAAAQDEVVGNEHNAYGALVDHSAVCEGYTRAFQYLCAKAGLTCVSVNGICEDRDAAIHIWNAVSLDGDWYYVDTTWNDYNPEDADYHVTDIEKHRYFNITTEQLTRDHTINPLYGAGGDAACYNSFVPECTAQTYNYFQRSVPVLEDLDNCGDFLDAFTAAAADGADSFAFRVGGDLDYGRTMDAITNDGYALDWIARSNQVNERQLSTDSLVFTYEELNVAAFGFVYE